jgi:hypothetical protein
LQYFGPFVYYRSVSVATSADWVECPDKIVFMEHDRLDRAGRVLERVDRDRLQKIADVLNERDRKGQLCPITPGHTEDDAPEHEQPPHWGYARQFEVVWDDQKRKHVLKACWYIRREYYEAAKTFPNVSPEYWHADAILDPISLLRRTPKLDLGQWIYAKRGRVIRYAMVENDMAEPPVLLDGYGNRFFSTEGSGVVVPTTITLSDVSRREHYMAEEKKSAPEDKGGHKASEDPAEKGIPKGGMEGHATPQSPEGGGGAGLQGVDPKFHEQFRMAMHHHYATGEHHRYMLMYPHHPEHHAMAGGMGMGMPGPTSGFVPGSAANVPGGTTVPPGGESVSRMQKNQTDIEMSRYQRELEEMRGYVQSLRQAALDSAHERDFYALLGQGYSLNVEKEVKRTASLEGAAYADYLTNVKENYRRTPGHHGDEMISTVGGAAAVGRSQNDEAAFDEQDLRTANKYMREQRARTGKDPSWDECAAYARKQRNGSR